MKKFAFVLIGFITSATVASAQILFDPDLSTGTTPTGYTEVTTTLTSTTGAGSITYDGGAGTLTAADQSADGTKAYITATGAVANSSTIESQITFTPNYTYVPYAGYPAPQSSVGFTLFYLATTTGNNPLLTVSLNLDNYGGGTGGEGSIILGTGLQFGAGTTTGTTAYNFTGAQSLSGAVFTLDDVETSVNTGGLNWQITNNATLYENGSLVQTFNYTTTGAANGSDYDPTTNTLLFRTGISQNQYGGGASANSSILDPSAGANIVISNVSVAAVPEPSIYAFLGLGVTALILLGVRKKKSETPS